MSSAERTDEVTDSGADRQLDAEEVGYVLRARQGNEAAWEWLVRRYQEPVFRLAYLIMGDADDAEDVAQETFVRAYLSLDRFDVSRPLRPWLMQIAANLARNRRRSLGRYWGAVQRFFQISATRSPLPTADATGAAVQHRLEAAHHLSDGHLPVQTAAWYRKRQATFSDAIALVRYHLWTTLQFVNSPVESRFRPIPDAILSGLVETICYAR